MAPRPPWISPCRLLYDLPCPAGPVAGRGDRLLRRPGVPLAPGPRRRRPASGPHGRLRRAGGTGRGGTARGGRAHRRPGPGRCLDLGALAAAVPAPAGCRPGRAGRAGPGYPGGRRLLHPPCGRTGQRAARPRRMAGGHPDRRGSPQQAVAADPRRRTRVPGQRARAHRIGGPRCGTPGGPRGPGAARGSAARDWPTTAAGAQDVRAPAALHRQRAPSRPGRAYDQLYAGWRPAGPGDRG